jgi:putative aldouronate transport system substrate-binding protein
MKKGKWNLMVSTLLVLSLVTVGCSSTGSNNNNEASPKPSSETELGPSAETNKPVTLKWLFMGPGKQQDADMVWEEFNKKLQDYLPNTTVEFTQVAYAEFAEKWKLIAASGEDYDLAWTGWLIPFVPEVNKGAYLPLNDLIDQYAPDLKDGVPDWVLQRATVDGEIYARPNQQMEFSGVPSLKVPKELADQYLDLDKLQEVTFAAETSTLDTYAPMEEYLQALKEQNLLGKGVNMSDLNGFLRAKGYEVLGQSGFAGYRITDDSFKVVNLFESEEYKASYQIASDWFKKGYIRKDVLSVQNPKADNGLKDGSVLWAHNHIQDGMPVNPGNENEGTVDYYNIPLGDKYYVPSGDSATSTAIPRTSKNPERAIQLIELMNTEKGKDLYNLLVWGIEGVHYNKVSDDTIETIGYSAHGSADAKYSLWKWVMGNTFNSYDNQSDTPGYNAFVKNKNDSAVKSPLMAFKLNTAPIDAEYTQLSAVIDEFNNALASGALPDFEVKYNQMLDKMKKAGADKIVAEIQKQVDEFVKENNIK